MKEGKQNSKKLKNLKDNSVDKVSGGWNPFSSSGWSWASSAASSVADAAKSVGNRIKDTAVTLVTGNNTNERTNIIQNDVNHTSATIGGITAGGNVGFTDNSGNAPKGI